MLAGSLLDEDRNGPSHAHLAPGLDQDLRQVAFLAHVFPGNGRLIRLDVRDCVALLDKVAFALVPAPDRADLHRRGQRRHDERLSARREEADLLPSR